MVRRVKKDKTGIAGPYKAKVELRRTDLEFTRARRGRTALSFFFSPSAAVAVNSVRVSPSVVV